MNLDINHFFQRNDFSIVERKNIQSLYDKIVSKRKLCFHITNDRITAKFNCSNGVISINNKETYLQTIHELLRAELIYLYNFPCLSEINNWSSNHGLRRFKNFIVDITNDLHHFIFYNGFVRLTSHFHKVKLISNQEKLINPEYSYEYLKKRFFHTENQIVFFYKYLYIPLKYKHLLAYGGVTWNLKGLEELHPKIYATIDNFFNKIVLFNYKTDISKNNDLFIEFYNEFFKNLKQLI